MSDNLPEKPKPTARQSMVRSKANGFSKGKSVDPVKREMTEIFEDHAETTLPRLVRKTMEAWERGLDSDEVRIAVDTAHKLTGHFYRPTANVKVEHDNAPGDTTFNIVNVDGLTATDKSLLDRAMSALGEKSSGGDVVESEIVDVIEEEDVG